MHRINHSAIEVYARRFAQLVSDTFFKASSTISGPQIMALTDAEALNRLIISFLLATWKEETKKLQSPYFDFQAAEVKTALSTFMNTLSRHISIRREDLEPLLIRATAGALVMAADPAEFIREVMFRGRQAPIIRHDEFISSLKHYKLHPDFWAAMAKATEANPKKDWKKEDLLAIADTLEATHQPGALDTLTEVLSFTLAARSEDFLAEDLQQKLQSPTKNDQVKENKTLNETFARETVTLNDLHSKKDEQTTLLDKHLKNKIVDIKTAITINQRFMFVKELFNGDGAVFDEALDVLESSADYEEAINKLLDGYADRFGWDTDKPEVTELFELVGRKFFMNN